MGMTYGVAMTAYHEERRGRVPYQWIRESIAPALAHPAVSEVFVYDDTGTADSTARLAEALGPHDKLRIEGGDINLGVFGAKVESVARAGPEWVLMADSDNVFGADALDTLASLRPSPPTLYAPSFGRPALDYREMCGRWTLRDFPRFNAHRMSGCAINTGNEFVNRDAFLAVFAHLRGGRWDLKLPDYLGVSDRSDVKWRRVYDSFDSGFINSQWWLAAGAIEIVPGFEYVHGSLTPEHQAVARSSWDNAPEEKDRLPAIFIGELLEAARRIA